MLNKKLVNIGAFLLFIWMVWTQYHKNLRIEKMEENLANMTPSSKEEAKYTVSIDPNKKVEDYTWFEWMVYKLYMKDTAKPNTQNAPILVQHPTTQSIPPGSRILYSCKPSGAPIIPTWCADGKEVQLGMHILPDTVENVMMHTPIGQAFRVGLLSSEVFGKKGDTGQMLFFDITVEKVLETSGANSNG